MATYSWEDQVTYPHIEFMSNLSFPFCYVIILCHKPLYSFFQCHHPLPSTSFFLYCCPCHGNPPSKWSYNIVGEYLYKLRLPMTSTTVNLLMTKDDDMKKKNIKVDDKGWWHGEKDKTIWTSIQCEGRLPNLLNYMWSYVSCVSCKEWNLIIIINTG